MEIGLDDTEGGLIEAVYHILWRKRPNTPPPKLQPGEEPKTYNYKFSFKLPDTIIYKRHRPFWWYFTAKPSQGDREDSHNNRIRKKRATSLNDKSIFTGFGSSCRSVSDIVAVWYSTEKVSPTSSALKTCYLDRRSLAYWLTYSHDKDEGALQLFIDPKPGPDSFIRNCVIQSVWQLPNICFIEKRENKNGLNEKRLPFYDRTETFEGYQSSRKVPIASQLVHEAIKKGCVAIVQHFLRVSHRQVKRMTLNWKIDGKDTLWFLYCGELDLVPAAKPRKALKEQHSKDQCVQEDHQVSPPTGNSGTGQVVPNNQPEDRMQTMWDQIRSRRKSSGIVSALKKAVEYNTTTQTTKLGFSHTPLQPDTRTSAQLLAALQEEEDEVEFSLIIPENEDDDESPFVPSPTHAKGKHISIVQLIKGGAFKGTGSTTLSTNLNKENCGDSQADCSVPNSPTPAASQHHHHQHGRSWWEVMEQDNMSNKHKSKVSFEQQHSNDTWVDRLPTSYSKTFASSVRDSTTSSQFHSTVTDDFGEQQHQQQACYSHPTIADSQESFSGYWQQQQQLNVSYEYSEELAQQIMAQVGREQKQEQMERKYVQQYLNKIREVEKLKQTGMAQLFMQQAEDLISLHSRNTSTTIALSHNNSTNKKKKYGGVGKCSSSTNKSSSAMGHNKYKVTSATTATPSAAHQHDKIPPATSSNSIIGVAHTDSFGTDYDAEEDQNFGTSNITLRQGSAGCGGNSSSHGPQQVNSSYLTQQSDKQARVSTLMNPTLAQIHREKMSANQQLPEKKPHTRTPTLKFGRGFQSLYAMTRKQMRQKSQLHYKERNLSVQTEVTTSSSGGASEIECGSFDKLDMSSINPMPTSSSNL